MFLAQITSSWSQIHNLPQRVFKTEHAALKWVEKLATKCVDSSNWVEEATVSEITRSGTIRLIDTFNGHDRGDGRWTGWDRKCTWSNERFTCRGDRAKESTVCAYHKRWPHLLNWDDRVEKRPAGPRPLPPWWSALLGDHVGAFAAMMHSNATRQPVTSDIEWPDVVEG